jgi:DNA repair photolyase
MAAEGGGGDVTAATGTREWRPNSENCLEGCENDCLYCYGALKAVQYKRRTRENWHEMKPNKRSQKPVRKLKGGVMFPTTHDLHFRHLDWWSPFLTDLLDCGNDVLIVSKPELKAIQFICDNFTSRRDQIEFRFTIGTVSEVAQKFWEPGAPNIHERIQALRYAYERGYKTSVSMEPLLDRNPNILIWRVSPWVSETIWIGTMNHMSSEWCQDVLSKHFYNEQILVNSRENMQRIYDENKNNPQIRWKDSVQKLLGVAQCSH